MHRANINIILLAGFLLSTGVLARGDEAQDDFQHGLQRAQAGDLAGAQADFTAAIELQPNFFAAYNARGLAIAGRAKDSHDAAAAMADAIADYTKAIALHPAFADAYYNRGVALQAGGIWADAAADYNKVIALTPPAGLQARAWLGLGELRHSQHDEAGAAQDYASAYYYHGLAAAGRGETNQAVSDFGRAVNMDAQMNQAYYARGTLEKKAGEWTNALADFDRAIALNPRYFEALNNRGNVRETLKDLPGAIADYTAALAVEPANAKLLMNLGLAKGRQGDRETANEDLIRAVKMEPSLWRYIQSRGYLTNSSISAAISALTNSTLNSVTGAPAAEISRPPPSNP